MFQHRVWIIKVWNWTCFSLRHRAVFASEDSLTSERPVSFVNTAGLKWVQPLVQQAEVCWGGGEEGAIVSR